MNTSPMKLLLIAGAIVVVVLCAMYFFRSTAQAPVLTESATTTPATSTTGSPSSIVWKINETETNAAGTPHAEVSVIVDGITNVIGTYAGNCSEIGASGGVDGTGLLAGELSAVQCYWAGGGTEIGVFAHEDGGYDIMVGEIDEPTAETPGFRGNFKIL